MFLRFARLIPGLLLFGIADAFMIEAAVGISPWVVFAQGLSMQVNLSIGLLTTLIGFVVLLMWIPLKQKPGIGTILNILLIGPGMEIGLWLLPTPDALWLRVAYFTIGMLLLAVSTGIYIGAHLGPGPRDGLMTGLHARFGMPLWVARSGIEVSVLAAGWIMGGNAGIGTVAFALLIGPLCGITIPFFDPQYHAEKKRGKQQAASPSVSSAVPKSAPDPEPTA